MTTGWLEDHFAPRTRPVSRVTSSSAFTGLLTETGEAALDRDGSEVRLSAASKVSHFLTSTCFSFQSSAHQSAENRERTHSK